MRMPTPEEAQESWIKTAKEWDEKELRLKNALLYVETFYPGFAVENGYEDFEELATWQERGFPATTDSSFLTGIAQFVAA